MRWLGFPPAWSFPALLLIALAACASSDRSDSAGDRNQATASATSASATSASATSASATSGSAGSSAVSMVSCTGSTCSVTLAGTGSRAHVLGTSIALRGVDDDRATLRVGDRTVTCAPGDSAAAGALRLTCTSVADGVVEFTASSQ